jgi:hypothetical protein
MLIAPVLLRAQQIKKDSIRNAALLHFAPAGKYLLGGRQYTVAPASYSASFINPGFFCRQEVKLDKKLPVPLRIRLGSIQYCNFLEQKPGYRNPQQ